MGLYSTLLVLLTSVFIAYVFQLNDDDTRVFSQSTVQELKEETDQYTQTTVYFNSHQNKLEAWLYTPKGVEKPPIIVMAHGFGAQKDFGLVPFAKKFVSNGYGVLLFDYRGFGGSEGSVRNEIDHNKHLQDWENAVTFAHTLKNFDGDNIILFGSSYSGGHVVVTAATHPLKKHIKAVISQVPFVSGIDSALSILPEAGISWLLKVTLSAFIDLTRSVLGLSRYYIPITGDTSSGAVLVTREAEVDYPLLAPSKPRGGWKNLTPAWAALAFIPYSPKSYASEVQAKTLVIFDSKDTLCPYHGVKEMGSRIKNVEMKEFSDGHFSAYERTFDVVSLIELEFLDKIFKK
eukprot:TRINITY_DN5301_c0_g1_i1.p1 TRINITY_DN5301_c0_g1~~TRINITY_DN5301_c0_g1_i1.p1  ORF type:complete len:347 (+),score=46.78 TRINITY_DN5301_c0_g1_i1:17-1057(+)